MKILFVASEALPFAATGGLADVAGSLPGALCRNGAECRVVLPLYSDISPALREKFKYITNFYVDVAWRHQYCGLFEAEAGGVTYYLLDNEYYFKRKGLYGHYDDAERFIFFSLAVLEMLQHIDFKPDILHLNDWHTALTPIYYKAYYEHRKGYEGIKTVLTIHNIQYQGEYGREIYNDLLGLPEDMMPVLEFGGHINFMKAAIMMADAVTTVSPTYAQELEYPYYAHGLNGILGINEGKITGILNGIDYENYNPQTDGSIFRTYSAESPQGKAENKRGLQKMLGLPQDKTVLVVGMVSRLVEQKGIELVKYALEDMMRDHIQFILLGKGDSLYEAYFSEMQKRFPGKVSVSIGFFQDIARKIYAGSDVLLMPSKSEPCGLAQMIALRYGTVPIVRETGGLKDSVTDCGGTEGNGFTFQSFNAGDMMGAIRRAEGLFAHKDLWNALVKRAMKCDFSWEKSARGYMSLYERLLRHQ